MFSLFFASRAWAEEIPSVAEEGMTLWQLIQNGGWVMAALGLLSVLAVTLILYFFVTVRGAVFIPSSQLLEIKKALENKNSEKAKALCRERRNLLERVVYVGASYRGAPLQSFRIKMEEEGRRAIELFWQRISFLSDIAALAPMLGLLGTVLGMIRAFNAIAFKIGEVKPIFMAYGVSQAMVTTAAGLILGIFSMVFYFFFRSRIQTISIRAESIIDSIADQLEKK